MKVQQSQLFCHPPRQTLPRLQLSTLVHPLGHPLLNLRPGPLSCLSTENARRKSGFFWRIHPSPPHRSCTCTQAVVVPLPSLGRPPQPAPAGAIRTTLVVAEECWEQNLWWESAAGFAPWSRRHQMPLLWNCSTAYHALWPNGRGSLMISKLPSVILPLSWTTVLASDEVLTNLLIKQLFGHTLSVLFQPHSLIFCNINQLRIFQIFKLFPFWLTI